MKNLWKANPSALNRESEGLFANFFELWTVTLNMNFLSIMHSINTYNKFSAQFMKTKSEIEPYDVFQMKNIGGSIIGQF